MLARTPPTARRDHRHPHRAPALGAAGAGADARDRGGDPAVLRPLLRRARLPQVLRPLGGVGRPRRRRRERDQLDGLLRAGRLRAGARPLPPRHRGPHPAVHGREDHRHQARRRRHVLQGVPDRLRLGAQRRGLSLPVPGGAVRAVEPDLAAAHAALRRLLPAGRPRRAGRAQLRPEAPHHPQRPERQPRAGAGPGGTGRLGRRPVRDRGPLQAGARPPRLRRLPVPLRDLPRRRRRHPPEPGHDRHGLLRPTPPRATPGTRSGSRSTPTPGSSAPTRTTA